MKPRSPASATEDSQRRLAVLIDADNAQPSVIEGLLAEVAKFGVASVKRIYGDFTSTQQTQWKKALLRHSISPVQQFAYTVGKNATDASLIIDAMDLMYTGRFDAFCLVSSDSDFTRLAQRLREEGLTVYGFGERKTPDAFVKACDKFIYTEVLRAEPAVVGTPAGPAKKAARKNARPAAATTPAKPVAAAAAGSETAALETAASETAPARAASKAREALPVALIKQALEQASDDSGWAALGPVGSYLGKVSPDFDPRLYGHKKLSDLFKAQATLFELEERGTPGTPGKVVYVRARR